MKEKTFEVKFETDPYIAETYGINQYITTLWENPIDLPFYGQTIADCVEGEYKSYFVADKNIPFDESIAKKVIEDNRVNIQIQHGLFVRRDSQAKNMVRYIIPYKNQASSIFRPTIWSPISNAVNVLSDVEVEILFSFDNYLLPILKHYKVGNYNLMDIVDDIRDTLTDASDEEFFDFFRDSGNFIQPEDDIFKFIVSSPVGDITEIEFYKDKFCRNEIMQSIVSIRIVELKEIIL